MNEIPPQQTKILVVDDNSIDRRLLSHHLEGGHYSVTQAENGHQALQILSSGEFDVIILDLEMPEMDGFETLKRLKVDSTLQHIPVIVISSMEDMESVTRCIRLGAIDHLSKPFDPVLLRLRVRSALALRLLYGKEAQPRGGVSDSEPAKTALQATVESKRMGSFGFMRCLCTWARPYQRHVALFGFGLVLSMAIAAALPLGFKYLTDYALIPHDLRALILILVLLVVAELVSAGADLGRDYHFSRFTAMILNDLRFNMFRHLQSLPMGFYGRTSTGEITSFFTIDLAVIDNAISTNLSAVLCQLVMTPISFALLFALEWRLALLAGLGLFLSWKMERMVEPRAEAAGHRMKEEQARIAGVLLENVHAQPVVKIFHLQRLAIEHFKHRMLDFFQIAARATFLYYLAYRVPNRFISFFSLLLLGCGSLLVYYGQMTLGTLVSFQMLLGSLVGSVSDLTWGLPVLLQAGVSMERIEGLLSREPDTDKSESTVLLPRPRERIEFNGVCFSYSQNHPNIENISLTIPLNGFILFVGPSGCGKSTILKLLLRFYDPSAGSIVIDGHNLRNVTEDSLRLHMSAVLQEDFLFDTTIRENIRMGHREASNEETEAAAKAAEIHDVILKMPDGYDTIVGERGGNLSGGQRQRLSLARAILPNPAILLLDEATSALDPATSASVNRTIERLGMGRTVISVTHRLDSAPKADHIFVLHEGRLTEHGRHDELLRAGGLYAELWRKQTGFSLSDDGSRAGVDTTRLRDISFLEKLDDACLSMAAGLFTTEHLPPGRTVVHQGDEGDRFYMILRGRVSVCSTSAYGKEQSLAVLEDGDHFGEIALIRGIPQIATVLTLTDCVFLSLNRKHFLDLISTDSQLRETMGKDKNEG